MYEYVCILCVYVHVCIKTINHAPLTNLLKFLEKWKETYIHQSILHINICQMERSCDLPSTNGLCIAVSLRLPLSSCKAIVENEFLDVHLITKINLVVLIWGIIVKIYLSKFTFKVDIF